MNPKARSIRVILIAILALTACVPSAKIDIETEKTAIAQVVHNSIGWALDKDQELLFNCVAQDSSFFIYHPDAGSTIIGFEAFRQMVEDVFMNEAFQATGFSVRDLRINLSRSGDVAWYSAVLDDHGKWGDKPTSWIDTRWTGVLEKRDGTWVLTQMHFSFASD